jgi:pimeloyl-[acyl-carrier protein] methyl ester esterase
VFRHGEPDIQALRGGLELLHYSDFRSQLDRIGCPMYMVLGERDQLVPKASIAATQALKPSLQGAVIPGAAHAPFLSHPEPFLHHLEALVAS